MNVFNGIKCQDERLLKLTNILDAAGVSYRFLMHEHNLSSSEDGAKAGLGALCDMAPTFILQTEDGILAAIIRGDTRLSYKKIKQKLGLKNVSLCAPDQVRLVTGAEVGHVALINEGLKTIIDEHVLEKPQVYGGTGLLNHTLQIDPRALVHLTQAQVFHFSEVKGIEDAE